MSNNASLSAAKRRRGGVPPPMSQPPGGGGGGPPNGPMMGGGGGPGNLPPGLPPNFRQLPPQVQQQMIRQLQQRNMAQAAHTAGPPAPMGANKPNTPVNNSFNAPGGIPPRAGDTNGPYMVNSVLHNRATIEVNGLHIRDLPMTSTGLPCLPSGAPLPPNVLFKLHHDELLNQDASLNEYSNKLQLLTNRVDKIDRMGSGGGANGNSDANTSYENDSKANISYDTIIDNGDFISRVVDNILTNTNLSEIINQIEPLQKENESLRSLLNSQQTTLNELSGLVMKLINNGLPTYGTKVSNTTTLNEYESVGLNMESYENGDMSGSVYNSEEVTTGTIGEAEGEGQPAEAEVEEDEDAGDDSIES